METTWDIGILNFTKELNLSFCNGTYIENCKEFELDEIGYDRDLIEKIVRVIVPVFFGMIGILGLIGNTLVVIVVAANPGMRSTTNILIINLAVADLLFVIFCIPFTATDFVLPFWPFGNIWCKIVQYLIIVTAYASVYTLVLMSLDRTWTIRRRLVGSYRNMIGPFSRLWRGARVSAESRRGRRRVTRLVLVVVGVFAICWCPIQVILVTKSLEAYPLKSATIMVQIASHILAYTNSCVNPILYAFLSDNFRKAFRKIIYCRPRQDPQRSGPSTKTTRAASTGDIL
ncbi:allatostatin-A receptor-like isoform X4 [Vespa crabro]|uniref:allatostatin-A receptor-like isoform X4 n=1 Tax=Vespa crabro TaxID=7445 RepID=UPI001F0193E7|nr:allatostatin-A receptor-like isoform X4 [Vespa crabro]